MSINLEYNNTNFNLNLNIRRVQRNLCHKHVIIRKGWIMIGKCVKVEMEIWNMGSFAAYAVPKYKKIKEKKRRGFIVTCNLVLPASKINYDVGFEWIFQKWVIWDILFQCHCLCFSKPSLNWCTVWTLEMVNILQGQYILEKTASVFTWSKFFLIVLLLSFARRGFINCLPTQEAMLLLVSELRDPDSHPGIVVNITTLN